MDYLIAMIACLLGYGFYQKSKRNSAEARNENIETKEKLLDKDRSIANNDAALSEEEKRLNNLSKDLSNVKNTEPVSLSSLIEFFTKRK